MALTISTAYKTNTVASVSGTTFTSNGTPFVVGDVGRFLVFTNGAAIGQIRRITGYTSTTVVTVDLYWNTSNVTGFTDSLPAAGNTWVMSSTLDDIDDGVHIIKESAGLYRQVVASGLVTIGTGVFVADTSLAFEFDSNLFKLHTAAFCQFGYLAPGGYGMYGCTLIDLLATTSAGGFSGSSLNGDCGDLHLYGCNISSSLTANPFWRLYRGDDHIVRFIDCDFSGNFAGRLRGTRSALLRCPFRGNTTASTIAGIGAIANFGLISECRVQACNQAIYCFYNLGVGTVTSPRFDAISGRIFGAATGSTADGTYVIEDYIESQVTSAATVVNSGITDAGALLSFRQWVNASIVNTSLATITDSARRVIRNGAAAVVDNVTTTSGSFSRYTAEVKRFAMVSGNIAWAAGTSYGPYEEAVATYRYRPQTLSLPLATSRDVQFTMITDKFITETAQATVDAYTALATPCALYDRAKSWSVVNLADGWPTFGGQACLGDGSSLDLNGNHLVLDPAAASVFAVNQGTDTITVKTAATFETCATFDTLKNFASLTLASGVVVSVNIEADSDVIVAADLDQLTGTVTLAGTSRLDLSAPGTAPAGSSASGTTVRVIPATSGDVYDFTAWTFVAGSVFENTSGQPITLKLSPSATVPTLTETSGTITLDNAVSIYFIASGLLDATRVRLYNSTAAAEIDNDVVSGGLGYSFTLTSGTHYTPGDLIILLATYQQAGVAKTVLRLAGTANSDDLVFADTQTNWTGPNVLGIDGSAVVECMTDYVGIQVEITDTDNTTTKDRIAAFIVSAITAADGIRNWVGLDGSSVITYSNSGVEAQINTAVAAVEVINVKAASKLSVLDEFGLSWSDGIDHVDAVLGSSIIWKNPHAVFSVETGVSGLTPTESAQLAAISPSLVIINQGVQKASLVIPHSIDL